MLLREQVILAERTSDNILRYLLDLINISVIDTAIESSLSMTRSDNEFFNN